MKAATRTRYYGILIVIGVVLIIINILFPQYQLSAVGAAFAAVGLCRLIRQHRISSDPERSKQAELAAQDERNRFIAARAQQWTFFCSIYVELLIGIVLSYFVSDPVWNQAGQALCWLLCAQLIFYVILYYVLQRRY